MVNYEFIGARIREARLRKKLSQEQLAAMVDVGTSHISHIETGATIPSTKLLVELMNILDCDPNEVLCMETRSTRPILNSWLSELVADCNEDEIKIITDTVMACQRKWCHLVSGNRLVSIVGVKSAEVLLHILQKVKKEPQNH